MADDDDLIPDSGAVFTFGRSRFADNIANKFWIKNDPVVHVACGDEHSAVLTERGRVYVFGSNEWGQLGLGHRKSLNKPSFVKALKPEKIILLACGRSHTLVYSECRKLFSFGSNGDGQLGHGDKQDASIPKEVSTLAGISLKIISCGAYHSAALTEKGEVYVWGLNSDGQLGLGELADCPLPTKLTLEYYVNSLSCGYYHSALVMDNGLLFTFGENENGKLGLSDLQCDDTTVPQPVAKLESDKYVSVSCGARHTVAITEKRCLYSWGDGSHGQLGHGTMQLEIPLPKQVDLLNDIQVIYVSSGDGHTAVITNTGKIYTFGDGRHGKLGQGDECFSNLFKPTIITRFNGFHVKFAACGGCHMLVGAIRKIEEDKDMVNDKIIAGEEDMLNASMYSNKSITEANMTLKPSSITYPLVTPRDKRRHKNDDLLNNSLNLNTSLNSSLNMAQLNRTVVQLPTVLDRSRLPKIPGVYQISINNYGEKGSGRKEYKNSVDKDDTMKAVEEEGNVSNGVGRDKQNVTNTNKPLPESKTVKKQGGEFTQQQNSSKDPPSKKSRKDSDSGVVDRCKQITTLEEDVSKKPEDVDSADDTEVVEEEIEDEPGSKEVKKQKGRVIPVKEDKMKSSHVKKSKKMIEYESEGNEDSEDDGKKCKGKLKSSLHKESKVVELSGDEDIKKMKGKLVGCPSKKSKRMEESEMDDDDDDEEEYDDDDEEENDDSDGEEENDEDENDDEYDVNKRKGKITAERDKMKGKTVQKSKKVKQLENEGGYDDSGNEMEGRSKQKEKLKSCEVKAKSGKMSKIIKESDENDDGEEEGIDDENEEDSYEQQESPVVKKKGKKSKIQQKEDQQLKKKKDISKQSKVKENKDEKCQATNLKKRTSEKNLAGKKKEVAEEEQYEEEEEDDEEEDDETEEEDENDDDDERDDAEGDGEGSEQGPGKSTKKKDKEKAVVSNEADSEESKTETNNNRSGFLNFFRRNKKPQVDVEPASSKSSEKTQSPPEGGNRNQSKTCILL